MDFKLWMIVEKHEILDSIKVPLQSVRQTTGFSCGAAALRSIFQYYGVGPDEEHKFIDMMNSTHRDGTLPAHIVATAKDYGLCVCEKHELSINKLKKLLDQEKPIICPIQAYGPEKQYKNQKRKNGHYVVAIGYDDGHIFFEDPILKGRRGYLTYEEFNERWYDKDAEGTLYDHYGIVIWKKGDHARNAQYLTKARKIK